MSAKPPRGFKNGFGEVCKLYERRWQANHAPRPSPAGRAMASSSTVAPKRARTYMFVENMCVARPAHKRNEWLQQPSPEITSKTL